jgi:hypothetical protein
LVEVLVDVGVGVAVAVGVGVAVVVVVDVVDPLSSEPPQAVSNSTEARADWEVRRLMSDIGAPVDCGMSRVRRVCFRHVAAVAAVSGDIGA